MGKLYAAARAVAVLVAIVAAFTTIPYAAVVLLVLGAISGVGNSAEDNMRVFVISIVLAVGSKSLEAIPDVGVYLAAIFGGIGVATFGASIAGITLGLYRRTVGELMSKPAT
ncbi:hypothetical protein [Phenylobacterium sp.]|jgi:hypothetical protein|uniref:hypothetical protein n=1 Tax=Phenylobacterium sp. TaxID=1871053 RepID=UPI002E359477|nr:hypothetical protein [Phenylobacterium sp.]HEX3364076.1 hypothetical protein [Phenylobacterium sp.]